MAKHRSFRVRDLLYGLLIGSWSAPFECPYLGPSGEEDPSASFHLCNFSSSIDTWATMSCSRRFEFEGDVYRLYLLSRRENPSPETSLHSPSGQDVRIEALPSRGQCNFVSNRGNNVGVRSHQRSGDIGTSRGQGWHGTTQPELENSPRLGDEQHHHDAEEVDDQRTELNIIEYSPPSRVPKGSQARSEFQNYNQAGASSNKKNKHRKQSQSDGHRLRVQSQFNAFLEYLPSLKDWTSPLDEADRKTILRNLVRDHESALSTHTSSHEDFEPLSCTSAECVDIIPILQKYGEFTAKGNSLDRKIAYFRELVFVSSCAVALKINEDKDDKDKVYEVMRAFRGSDVQSKHLNKLVCGAKWANRAMSLLSQSEWAFRSWSVFFAGRCKRSIRLFASTEYKKRSAQLAVTLGLLSFLTETEQLLSDKVKTSIVGYSSACEITDKAAPLVIPLIVERLFRDSTS